MSTIVESLTRNIVNRDLQAEGTALLNKWEKTGLLEGLDNDRTKNSMARLLENQAKELLREASSMSAGDVEGFAAVAFPIVRRVFGGLIANELVSVQPMSLPSGLIFFLDFTYTNSMYEGSTNNGDAFLAGQSIYGGGVVGKGLADGVNLGSGSNGYNVEKGPYSLNNGYSSATGSRASGGLNLCQSTLNTIGINTFETGSVVTLAAMTDAQKTSILRDDPDEVGRTDSPQYQQYTFSTASFTNLNKDDLMTINLQSIGSTLAQQRESAQAFNANVIRRLTKYQSTNGNVDNEIVIVMAKANGTPSATRGAAGDRVGVLAVWNRADLATAITGVPGALELDLWEEGAGDGTNGIANDDTPAGMNDTIAEIDIKVDSLAVTATTKKLKAKWSPELAQDLNAYHNLDAEVELTSILSEQVALEIDQEVLNDLVTDAKAGTKFWSRRPGKFVNRDTGAQVGATTSAPDFTGTVSEWYETLCETINDVSAQIHRKTLRGGANFVVCSPEVANLLEFTSGFRATVNADELKGGSIGAVKVGSLSKKFDVYVDPYFPRNVVLVGRRGNSFLESGYVYAPYVPLQVTPTIFGVEDFVPRKGVMTRYAKKMVRPDMYGKVIVQDLIG